MHTISLLCTVLLLILCNVAVLPRCALAQGPLNPYTVTYNTSNTLRFVVLPSHCVVVDLDLVFVQRLGYTGTVILDGEVEHGHLWHGDVAGDTPPPPSGPRRTQTPIPLKRGGSLDYGAGTISYCPTPLNLTAPQKAERDGTIANDTVPVRFTPTPVTREHPVQHYQLQFSVAALTFEPLALATTTWVNGWEWIATDDHPDDGPAGAEERAEHDNDADGDADEDDDDDGWSPLSPNPHHYVAPGETFVLPIAVAPRAELRQHWRVAKAGDIVRYTLRSSVATNTTADDAAAHNATGTSNGSGVEPGMEALEAIEIFSLDGRADFSPCVLYAVEEGNIAETGIGDNYDVLVPLKITTLPYTFPPTTQIRFRVNLTTTEVRSAMADWMRSTIWPSAEDAPFGGTAQFRGGPSICSVAFRGRQSGSATFTPAGEVRVEWTPAPHTIIEAENITISPFSQVPNYLYVSARPAEPGAGATPFTMTQLCMVMPPPIPHLIIKEEFSRHCVVCIPSEPTCAMKLVYSYAAHDETLPNAARVDGASAESALQVPGIDVVGRLKFVTISTHSGMPSHFYSGSTQVEVRLVPHELVTLYFRHFPRSPWVVTINETAEVPVVLDVSAAVPPLFRSYIAAVTVDGVSIDQLRGQLCSQAEAPTSLSEAQRGIQWRLLRRNSYLPLPVVKENQTHQDTSEGHMSRKLLKMQNQPTLLRYTPPASWWSATSCTAATANGSVMDEEVRLSIAFEFNISANLQLIFRMAAPKLCPQPDTPTTITTHAFVHRHAANPLQLPFPQPVEGGDDTVQLVVPAPRALRIVSLPSRGTVSHAPSCYRPTEEGHWFLRHCEAAAEDFSGIAFDTNAAATVQRASLDAELGCVCCLQNCSSYVGTPLSVGTVLSSKSTVHSTSRGSAPFVVFYTPASPLPSTSLHTVPGKDSKEGLLTGEEEEAVVIQYTEWPDKQGSGQLYEVVLHIRAWPDTSLRAAYLPPLPASSDGTTPTSQTGEGAVASVYSVLRMSSRLDVETGLVGSSWGNGARFFPWRVYECVAVKPDGSGLDAPRGSYSHSDTPLLPIVKFGVYGYWPTLTRGCVVLETTGRLPRLVVHAVNTGHGDASAVVGADVTSSAKNGTAAAAVVATATLQLQPYLLAWTNRANVTWVPQVAGEDSLQWALTPAGAVDEVRVTAPKPWGFVPAGGMIHPFQLTVQFRQAGNAEGGAVYVRLSQAPQRGCAYQPPRTRCLQSGQRLSVARCDGQPPGEASSVTRWCIHLSYLLQRTAPYEAVHMRDVVELAASASDGAQIGRSLVIALVGRRPMLGGHFNQVALAAVALLFVVLLTGRRRTARWLRKSSDIMRPRPRTFARTTDVLLSK